jgi:multidrug efflux system membrane fusion protein
LTFLDNNVQEVTGTLKLRATLPNADHHFWPGRFVKVRLILDTLRNAVLIPAGTPLTSAQGPFVYVVKDDNTAEMRVIKPGQRQGDMLVILDGVKAGERVITTGQFLVQPGGKVHVTDPAAAVGSPAGAPAAAGENK